MGKPVGGRGHKGVGTTHIRVPLPIKDDVRELIEKFYQNEGSPKVVNTLPSLEEAMALAKSIASQKKSARVSLSKLLNAIYGGEVEI